MTGSNSDAQTVDLLMTEDRRNHLQKPSMTFSDLDVYARCQILEQVCDPRYLCEIPRVKAVNKEFLRFVRGRTGVCDEGAGCVRGGGEPYRLDGAMKEVDFNDPTLLEVLAGSSRCGECVKRLRGKIAESGATKVMKEDSGRPCPCLLFYPE